MFNNGVGCLTGQWRPSIDYHSHQGDSELPLSLTSNPYGALLPEALTSNDTLRGGVDHDHVAREHAGHGHRDSDIDMDREPVEDTLMADISGGGLNLLDTSDFYTFNNFMSDFLSDPQNSGTPSSSSESLYRRNNPLGSFDELPSPTSSGSGFGFGFGGFPATLPAGGSGSGLTSSDQSTPLPNCGLTTSDPLSSPFSLFFSSSGISGFTGASVASSDPTNQQFPSSFTSSDPFSPFMHLSGSDSMSLPSSPNPQQSALSPKGTANGPPYAIPNTCNHPSPPQPTSCESSPTRIIHHQPFQQQQFNVQLKQEPKEPQKSFNYAFSPMLTGPASPGQKKQHLHTQQQEAMKQLHSQQDPTQLRQQQLQQQSQQRAQQLLQQQQQQIMMLQQQRQQLDLVLNQLQHQQHQLLQAQVQLEPQQLVVQQQQELQHQIMLQQHQQHQQQQQFLAQQQQLQQLQQKQQREQQMMQQHLAQQQQRQQQFEQQLLQQQQLQHQHQLQQQEQGIQSFSFSIPGNPKREIPSPRTPPVASPESPFFTSQESPVVSLGSSKERGPIRRPKSGREAHHARSLSGPRTTKQSHHSRSHSLDSKVDNAWTSGQDLLSHSQPHHSHSQHNEFHMYLPPQQQYQQLQAPQNNLSQNPQVQQLVRRHSRGQQIHHLPLPDKSTHRRRSPSHSKSRDNSPHLTPHGVRSRSHSGSRSSSPSQSGSMSSEEQSPSPMSYVSTNFDPLSEANDSDGDESPSAYDQYPSNFPRFKIPTSKSPVIEALACCAVYGWGVSVLASAPETDTSSAKVIFKVTDFQMYYNTSRSICSKQNPTDNLGSRVKALRRWFVRFPKKSERKSGNAFTLEVKPEVAKKVYEIVDKFRQSAQAQAQVQQHSEK